MNKAFRIKLSLFLLVAANVASAQPAPKASAKKAVEEAYKMLDSGNFDAALKRFQALAAAGNTEAMLGIAQMYYHGSGVPRDALEFVRWFQKAAEAGDSEAQFQLGRAHEIGGLGIAPIGIDKSEAAKWYLLAAESGHSNAQFNLATLYSEGQGVPRNIGEMAKWVQRSADQDNIGAQDWLARMYKFGDNPFPKDLIKAYMWYAVALRLSKKTETQPDPNGPPPSPFTMSNGLQMSLKELVSDMTPPEIATAEEMARTWKPKTPTGC